MVQFELLSHVACMRSKCFARGLLFQGLKHLWSALSPLQAIVMDPPVKSWYVESSQMVDSIPYIPYSSLWYAHWSSRYPGVISFPLPNVVFILLW